MEKRVVFVLGKGGVSMPAEDHFRQFVERVEETSSSFLAGDPTPFKAFWSHADDVILFGGRGSYEQGWEQVSSRLDWAAAGFRDGKLTYEPLAAGVSGDLAYSVGIERGEVSGGNHEAKSPLVLRITHLYRREEGIWKLIHRHADPAIEKT